MDGWDGSRIVCEFGLRVEFLLRLTAFEMPAIVVRLSLLAGQTIGFNVDLPEIVRVSRPLLQRQDHFGRILEHGRFELLLLPADYRLVVDLHQFVALFDFTALVCRALELNAANDVDALIGRLNEHSLNPQIDTVHAVANRVRIEAHGYVVLRFLLHGGHVQRRRLQHQRIDKLLHNFVRQLGQIGAPFSNYLQQNIRFNSFINRVFKNQN